MRIIDFPIHLLYKTVKFEALGKIQEWSTTTSNHFIETLLMTFHYIKSMKIGSSPKFRELGVSREVRYRAPSVGHTELQIFFI